MYPNQGNFGYGYQGNPNFNQGNYGYGNQGNLGFNLEVQGAQNVYQGQMHRNIGTN